MMWKISAVDRPNISMPSAASTAPVRRWAPDSPSSLAPMVVKLAREE